MDTISSPRTWRILSGSPLQVENLLNSEANEYAPMTWNYSMVGVNLLMTVVCVHQSKLRQAQLMAPLVPGQRPI